MATVKQQRDAPYANIVYLVQITPLDSGAPTLYLSDRNITDGSGQRYEAYIISVSGNDASINTITGQNYNANYQIVFDNAPWGSYNHLIEIPYKWNGATCKIYEAYIDINGAITTDKYLIFDGILDEPRGITRRSFGCSCSSITLRYDMQWVDKQGMISSTASTVYLIDGPMYKPIIYGQTPKYKAPKTDWGVRTALDSSISSTDGVITLTHPASLLKSTIVSIDNELIAYSTFSGYTLGSTLEPCVRAHTEFNSSGERIASSAVAHGAGARVSEYYPFYTVCLAGHRIYSTVIADTTIFGEFDNQLIRIDAGYTISTFLNDTSINGENSKGTFLYLSNRLIISPKDIINLSATQHTHEYSVVSSGAVNYIISLSSGDATYIRKNADGLSNYDFHMNTINTTVLANIAVDYMTWDSPGSAADPPRHSTFILFNRNKWAGSTLPITVDDVELNIVLNDNQDLGSVHFKILVNGSTTAFGQITHADFSSGAFTTFTRSITWNDRYSYDYGFSKWRVQISATWNSSDLGANDPDILLAGVYWKIHYKQSVLENAIIDKEGYVVNARHLDNIWVETKGMPDSSFSFSSSTGSTGQLISQGQQQVRHFLQEMVGYTSAQMDWSEANISTALKYTLGFAILDKITPSDLVPRIAREIQSACWYQSPNSTDANGKWKMKYLADTATAITPVKTVTEDDLIKGTDFEFDYSDLADLANVIRLNVRRDYNDDAVEGISSYARTVTVRDATSTAIYGDLSTTIDLEFLQSGTGTTNLADFIHRQKRLPLLIMRYQTYWNNFDLKVGDVIQLSYSLFDGKKFIIEAIQRTDTHIATITAREYWS